MNRRTVIFMCVLHLAVAAGVHAVPLSITDPLQGPVPINDSGFGSGELSGLTRAGSNTYHAVSDTTPTFFSLLIDIDSSTGFIQSNEVIGATALAAGVDLEGIAYNALNNSVYISDEIGPAIREYALSDGSLLQTLPIPAVFEDHTREGCCGFESLSVQAGHLSLWTANEEALVVDGPRATVSNPTVIRLLKYNAALMPESQWAYVTDPIAQPLFGLEQNGVSEILMLQDERLLVLERMLEGGAPFRIRIFEVDFTGATDVSGLDNLTNNVYTPVSKTLLINLNLGYNYEGMAIGPYLDDGTYSLLLVADDGEALSQNALYPLILSGLGPPDRDGDRLPDFWELQHFGGETNAMASGDPDFDNASNLDEYISDTLPTNGLSSFRIGITGTNHPIIHFPSSSNRVYTLQATDQLMPAVWSNLTVRAPGSGAKVSMTDTNLFNESRVYRVRVELP